MTKGYKIPPSEYFSPSMKAANRIEFRKLRLLKYELAKQYNIQTGMLGFSGHATQHGKAKIRIDVDGVLKIFKGYQWDGPSGRARDTLTFMRGSLVHDALYDLMRHKVLPLTKRKDADALMKRICLEDGMSPARAAIVYRGVRVGGKRSATIGKDYVTVHVAPRAARGKR